MFKGLKDFRRYEYRALANNAKLFYFVKENLELSIETNMVLHVQNFGGNNTIYHGGKLIDVWNGHGIYQVLVALLQEEKARHIHPEIRYYLPRVRTQEKMIELMDSIKEDERGTFPIKAYNLLKKADAIAEAFPQECGYTSRDFLHLEKGVKYVVFVKNKYGCNSSEEIEYFVFGKGRIELYDYTGSNGAGPIESININYIPSEDAIDIFFEDMYERGYQLL